MSVVPSGSRGFYLRRNLRLVTGATTATTAAPSARKPVGRLRGSAAGGAAAGAENRELYRVSLARALRAGNLLLLVQYDFLEMRLAILTNVFVNGHGNLTPNYKYSRNSSTVMSACRMMLRSTGHRQIEAIMPWDGHAQLRLFRVLQLSVAPALMMNHKSRLLKRAEDFTRLQDRDARRHQTLRATRTFS